MIVYANGIGPLSVKGAKEAVSALAGAASVSMRDGASLGFCLEHGINAHLTADPAFSLEHGFVPRVRGGYFVVAPKKTGREEYDLLRRVVKTTAEKYGLRPVVAAMYSAQDANFCKKLAKDTGALLLENGITDYGILTTAIAGAEFVISARFHALICACSVSCPMIAVGSEKNAALLRDIGLSWCAVKTYDAVPAVLGKMWDKRENIRESLHDKVGNLRAMAINETDEISKII